MPSTALVNYALYQAGWFACVLGAARGLPGWGSAVACTLAAVHVGLTREPAIELRLMAVAVVVGVLIETILLASGVYAFSSGTLVAGWPPPWMIALWMQFAATFRLSLRPILARPLRALAFGAVGGPLAFLAGERLGAVTFLQPYGVSLAALAVAWAVAMGFFSALIQRMPAASRAVAAYRYLPS